MYLNVWIVSLLYHESRLLKSSPNNDYLILQKLVLFYPIVLIRKYLAISQNNIK